MGPKSYVWPNFELKIGYKSRSNSKLFLVSQQEIDEFENSAQTTGNQETTAEITTLNEEPIIEMEESREIDLSPKMEVDRKLSKAQKIQRKTR